MVAIKCILDNYDMLDKTETKKIKITKQTFFQTNKMDSKRNDTKKGERCSLTISTSGPNPLTNAIVEYVSTKEDTIYTIWDLEIYKYINRMDFAKKHMSFQIEHTPNESREKEFLFDNDHYQNYNVLNFGGTIVYSDMSWCKEDVDKQEELKIRRSFEI